MTPSSEWLRDIAHDLKVAVQFCTRLPFGPDDAAGGADVARSAWAIPLAGALVGLLGALAYKLAHTLGIPPLPGAALTLATTMVATGCLHEDGLADAADGFGGGTTREKKFDIMRDSRIGTYGTGALVLSVLTRASAIASLAPALVMPALIAAHAAGRATMPILMWLVPPARTDGLSADASRVSRRTAAMAGTLGFIALAFAFEWTVSVAVALLLLLAVGGMARLCAKQIGGQTGDVLGALEQLGEIIVLLAAATRQA
jgi:adenosylcobinamide-GDP ribazoletransferase